MVENYELAIMNFIRVYKFLGKVRNTKEADRRKDSITRLNMNNMFRRTMRMFKWEGLPPEIPARVLELQIQTIGYTSIFQLNGKIYQSYGGLGGEPNYNYMPTLCIVSNPYLKLQAHTFHIYNDEDKGIKKDCVIIPNDSLYQGLCPLLSFHSEMLTEIELTKRCVYIAQRMPFLLTAPDDNTKRDLDDYLDDLDKGELASVFDKNFLKSIGVTDTSGSGARNLVTQLLEAQQYQKAALFNDLGMQLNYNMKRETITSSEAQLGEGALLPLPDDMMDMRKVACKEIKETFDLDWKVEFDSAWYNLRKSITVEMESEEADVANKKNPSFQSNGHNMKGENTEGKVEEPEEAEDVTDDNESTELDESSAEEKIEEIKEIVNDEELEETT